MSAARLSQLFETVLNQAPADQAVYLVGGAVRDMQLNRPVHDVDFIAMSQVRPFARRVAHALGGDFYMLDESRSTARVILHEADGERIFLDFCALRAPDLKADLLDRDFTVNAIAIDLRRPEVMIDPCGGLPDLQARVLRPCSEKSFQNDPLRILRGVRLGQSLGFRLPPETLEAMREAVLRLPSVSAERRRDELWHILAGRQASAAVRLLNELGALSDLLPELNGLHGMPQSAPHIYDGWEHTLMVLAELEGVWSRLVEPGAGGPDENPALLDAAARQLGRYHPQLREHFREPINPDRPARGLLFLAALLHDIGKPLARSVDPDGRIRFFGHEERGARLALKIGRRLALSEEEVARLSRIVAEHMRVHQLGITAGPPSRRAIFRFFRDSGPAGVEVILLSLADMLATYGPALPPTVWENELATARALLDGWFERPSLVVRPPRLLTGHDLMEALRIPPGPQVGLLLEQIREAQAAGEVNTREEALELARGCLPGRS